MKSDAKQYDGSVTAFLPIHEDGTMHVEPEAMRRLMREAGWREEGDAE